MMMRGGRLDEGTLRVKVIRGWNLAVRDFLTSDPYVVLTSGCKRVKTKVINSNLNPVWNEELTLCVVDPRRPIKLEVFDKDTFSRDDPMGKGEIDIQPLIEAGMFLTDTRLSGDIINVVRPTPKNCLLEWSNSRSSRR
ncbi:protein C2-DOMAIN ABA-RELATED 9-like isoform X2 [Wolffia australiana]